jgi:hypothetical protein
MLGPSSLLYLGRQNTNINTDTAKKRRDYFGPLLEQLLEFNLTNASIDLRSKTPKRQSLDLGQEDQA